MDKMREKLAKLGCGELAIDCKFSEFSGMLAGTPLLSAKSDKKANVPPVKKKLISSCKAPKDRADILSSKKNRLRKALKPIGWCLRRRR